MPLRATPSCSGTFTLLAFIYLLLNIFGCTQGISRSSQGSHLRGSPDHEDTAAEVREWGLTAKILLAFVSRVILATESHWTNGHILLSDGSEIFADSIENGEILCYQL
jgi:hypothetical protein